MQVPTDPVEQETQGVICKGEDLLNRTHEIARRIVERIKQAVGAPLEEDPSAAPPAKSDL